MPTTSLLVKTRVIKNKLENTDIHIPAQAAEDHLNYRNVSKG